MGKVELRPRFPGSQRPGIRPLLKTRRRMGAPSSLARRCPRSCPPARSRLPPHSISHSLARALTQSLTHALYSSSAPLPASLSLSLSLPLTLSPSSPSFPPRPPTRSLTGGPTTHARILSSTTRHVNPFPHQLTFSIRRARPPSRRLPGTKRSSRRVPPAPPPPNPIGHGTSSTQEVTFQALFLLLSCPTQPCSAARPARLGTWRRRLIPKRGRRVSSSLHRHASCCQLLPQSLHGSICIAILRCCPIVLALVPVPSEPSMRCPFADTRRPLPFSYSPKPSALLFCP